MWGNPTLFLRGNVLEEILRKDKHLHNQLRKIIEKLVTDHK